MHDQMSDCNSTDDDEGDEEDDNEEERLYCWPFHMRRAIRNLKRLGSGPWPYYTSVTYLMGVLLFTGALVAEFLGLPEEIEKQTTNAFFVLGSVLFTLGGFAECLENDVFTSLSCGKASFGAFLNLVGGLGFLVGSVLGYYEGQGYNASFLFGLGSLCYAVGSAAMIVMWKDEQFGLTFLSVLNQLGGKHGKPLVVNEETQQAEEKQTFSCAAAWFIIIYIFGATFSTYNFLIVLAALQDGGLGKHRIWLRALNVFLPAVLCHMMMALTCAVIQPPKMSPFRQLYVLIRAIAVLSCIGSGIRLFCAVVSGHGDVGTN